MRITSYIWSALLLLIFLLSLVTSWYDSLVYCINIITLLMMIDKLGKGIVLREIIALHCSFICLLMPLAGYLVYNSTNSLAVTWGRYMPIEKAQYFDFCLPAVAAFCLFLSWPIRSGKFSDEGLPLQASVKRMKERLENNQKVGIYLLLSGVAITYVVKYLPTGLQYIFNLLYFSSFTGLLYIYFSGKFRYKKIILIGVALFTVAIALSSGMFTIIAYMGMTLFSFFFLGRRDSMLTKLVTFLACFVVLAIIQSVKPTYRRDITLDPEANKAQVFYDLTMKKLSSIDNFLSPEPYFFLYYRANQGYNVALVLRRFPAAVPFDNGEYLEVKIAAAFVPRLLWPNKPEAGGLANMKYYANWDIKGFATNVGPVAEAYASFGITGGIIYMMLLGAFIRYAYRTVFVVGYKIPLVILWIPVMFYQVTYSSENDTLQILNSLIKSSFFIFILYKMIPSLLKPKKKLKGGSDDSAPSTVNQLKTSNQYKL